jgi:hypothetical protein
MAKISRSDRQTSLPGTSPNIGGLLRIKAAAPIKAPLPQRPCDVGLFSDDANQLDLVDLSNRATERE